METTLANRCRALPTAVALTRFVDAYNRADKPALDRAFAPADGSATGFKWFSLVERPPHNPQVTYVVRNRSRLIPFFLDRHGHHDRLRLRTVEVGRSWTAGSAAFSFTLLRTADDVRRDAGGPDGITYGKGELRCQTGAIWVWSGEMPPLRRRVSEGALGKCPKPPGWDAMNGPIVACALR